MPATMAGSRGGTIGRKPHNEGAELIEGLLTGQTGLNELYERTIATECPRNVTLVINNVCNLNCPHCYLQDNKLTAPQLTEEEWRLLIDSIVDLNPDLVCFSGKEVFAGDKGIRLLSYIKGAKERKQASCRIGLISNGTLMDRFRNYILQIQPSYLDISLDGIESDHDAIRGKGAFASSFPNVKWAAQALGERFFVNQTLQKQNFSRLKEAVDMLQHHGVRNISCGFYRPLSYTAQHLALSDNDIDMIFKRLGELEDLSLEQPIKILMDIDIVTFQPLKSFLRSEWFSLEKIQVDQNGEHYIVQHLRNGIDLVIRFSPYPTGVWRSVRITPEGNYLAAEDTIDTTLYATHGIGNVRDFDYDFARLHAYALGSGRFRGLLQEFYANILPELIAIYQQKRLLGIAA